MKAHFVTPVTFSTREGIFNKFYPNYNTLENQSSETLYTPLVEDLSIVGQLYANVVHSDEPLSYLRLLYSKDLSIFPLLEEELTIDDSYINAKGHNLYINSNNTFSLSNSGGSLYPQSYASVLDPFRLNFEEFGVSTELSNDFDATSDQPVDFEDDLINHGGVDARSVNPARLRATAKNSIVTHAALQKVSRA